MSHSKPLLIPWLRTKINSGMYPGVAWTNPEQTEFSIPWKHALRQDASRTDVLIFKAWAEVSGNGKAHGEPSVWKRNFRSALRVKGFICVSDNKNDTANPHKVYRWPEVKEASSGACSSAGSQEQDDPGLFEDLMLPIQETEQMTSGDDIYMPEENIFIKDLPTINSEILQQCLQGLNIQQGTDGIAHLDLPPEPQQIEGMIARHVLPEQPQHPIAYEDAVGGVGLPEQPAYPVDGAVEGTCDPQMVEQFKDFMSKTMEGDHFTTNFMVSVFYRGVPVYERMVQNEAGIRLVYRPELTEPVYDQVSGLTLVPLPSPVAIHDRMQTGLTKQILESLGTVDVGVSSPVVYGQRQGKTHAFWSLCRYDKSETPQDMSKEPQPLYMFKDFVQGMIDFLNGGKECPPCSLYLCLGEKWPCPENRPLEKKLIVVEVVLTSLDALKSLAVQGGASSLQSVELQISLEQMMELC